MRKFFLNDFSVLKSRRGALLLVLPITLVFLFLSFRMTASCQRAHNETGAGVEELRSLVNASAGKPSLEGLSAIESKYPKSRAAALARFLKGYLYYSSKDYQAAAAALDVKFIGTHSAISDYASFYRAESLAGAGNSGDAVREFRNVYEKQGHSLKAREARLRAAELMLAAGDPNGAMKEVTEMAGNSDADALRITAQAYEAKGSGEEAINLYRRIYYQLPATGAAERAGDRLAQLGRAPKDAPGSFEEERSRADELFQSKQYWAAARAYDDLATRFPETERDSHILLQRGISQLNSKQPAQAVVSLARVSSRDADLQAKALYHQAEALRGSNRTAESGVIVDRLIAQYPKTRWAEDALYKLASYYDKQGSAAQAAARFRQMLAAYPKSEYAPEASYELGWQAYQAKNYAEAARLLEKHLENYRYPDSKFIGEAGFWAGKSEERLGNRARALALYELVMQRYRYGYHGYVARLRADGLRKANPNLGPENGRNWPELERIRRNALHVETIEEKADGSEKGRLAKADDLEVIGLDDLFLKEMNELLASVPDSPKLNMRLAQFYSRQGDNFQATIILRRGYPDLYSYGDEELPREAWEIFFPMMQWETIKQEAKRYGIDPHIAAGLIRQESVFNPKAVSRVGARGLMQLMPATAQLVSKRQGGDSISAGDLFNPQINIKLGMNYLAQMLGQFGRIEYAAAGYNAGPARAKRWIAERGGMDIEDWIEAIPFTETRGYVQGVLRYAANYRRFYQ